MVPTTSQPHTNPLTSTHQCLRTILFSSLSFLLTFTRHQYLIYSSKLQINEYLVCTLIQYVSCVLYYVLHPNPNMCIPIQTWFCIGMYSVFTSSLSLFWFVKLGRVALVRILHCLCFVLIFYFNLFQHNILLQIY